MPTGWMAPAPMPWMRRNAIIEGIDQAKPHITDPDRKIPMPKNITTLRPKRSDSFPKTTVVAVWLRRKAENTQL